MSGAYQEPDASELPALQRFLSSDRLSTYITAANQDLRRALALYLWNARLGEAFHTPIQAVEVACATASMPRCLPNTVTRGGVSPGSRHCSRRSTRSASPIWTR
ncbi:MAG: hypothetical protein ACFE0R_14940 [Salinarimonas sp.]